MPVEPQHAPAAIARFDQRLEFALGIAPIEELVNQRTVNLAGAILPIHTSLSFPSRRSKHIPSTSASSLLVGLELISRLCRGSQMISRSTSGRAIPLAQRVNAPASIVRYMRPLSSSAVLRLFCEATPPGAKTYPRLVVSFMIHTAQHAVPTVQIQRCVYRSLHQLISTAHSVNFAIKPQLMTTQPTPPSRNKFSVFATTPCRGLSLSR